MTTQISPLFIVHHPSTPHHGLVFERAAYAERVAKTLRLEVLCDVIQDDSIPDTPGPFMGVRVAGAWILCPIEDLTTWIERATAVDYAEIQAAKTLAADLDEIVGDH